MATNKSIPRKAVRKILQNWGVVILTVMVFGLLSLPHQAQKAVLVTETVTSTVTKVATAAIQSTQVIVEETTEPSPTPTAIATQFQGESLRWIPLSGKGVDVPTSYMVDGVCSTLPTGWIIFNQTGTREYCSNSEQNLGEDLVLPANTAVIPLGSIPTENYHQTAAAGQQLKDPRELRFWAGRDANFGLTRVCLLSKYDSATSLTSYWLEIDEELDYLPVSGGECYTTAGNQYKQITFLYLNQIHKKIQAGDFRYEVHLDHQIQDGENQELWLGGQALSNN